MGGSFTFDGREIPFRHGQSLAAALTAAGIRAFRRTAGGAPRGVFCGMGVCQDCLVCVDGVPNLRACMTAARPGLKVGTQVAFPSLAIARAPEPEQPARLLAPEVLVIGAGPAGLAAAIAARRAGASVVVLDERPDGGGQFYKQAAEGPPLDAQQAAGAVLLAEARAAGADIMNGAEVWGAFDGPLVLAAQRGAALAVQPGALVVATGAHERPEMVPGWTLPGVMTTGAAQTLWRSYRTLPGRRVLVCGSGPLNLQVALELAAGGAEVVGVAERANPPWTQPVAALALVAAGPGLALAGARMLAGLRRQRVPLWYRSRLARVEAVEDGLAATIAGADGDRRTVSVDAVLMNAGFEPQNQILRLLGAAMDHDPEAGHLRCRRGEDCQTSVPGVFAAGDCAGLGGAPAALAEGAIAGSAAAATCGHGDGYDRFALLRRVAGHRRFQRRLWALHDIAVPPFAGIADETVVCRCEEIAAGRIRAEMATLAPGHAGTLKRATRLGMGRCQGRYCGPVATRIVAEATGRPIDDLAHFAPRVPVKPVAIAIIRAAGEALGNAP